MSATHTGSSTYAAGPTETGFLPSTATMASTVANGVAGDPQQADMDWLLGNIWGSFGSAPERAVAASITSDAPEPAREEKSGNMLPKIDSNLQRVEMDVYMCMHTISKLTDELNALKQQLTNDVTRLATEMGRLKAYSNQVMQWTFEVKQDFTVLFKEAVEKIAARPPANPEGMTKEVYGGERG